MSGGIFIAESSIGIHKPLCSEIDMQLISFTFRPSFQTILVPITDVCSQTYIRVGNPRAFKIEGMNDPASFLDEQYNRNVIAMIKDMYLQKGECEILLGQDNDTNGHFMASLLYYHLINVGIPKNKIIRVPLFSFGYNYETIKYGFTVFYTNSQLLGLLELERFQQKKINTKKRLARGNVGYRKDFALAHIYDRMKELNPEVKKISNGTCSATYFTKKALDERG